MRRSAHVFAPLLASAALALPIGPRAAGQQQATIDTARTTEQPDTVRNGFGESFREHPWMWIMGGAGVAFIFGPGG
jgi:hypothetical protein